MVRRSLLKKKGSWKELFKTEHSEIQYNLGKPQALLNHSEGLLSGVSGGEDDFEFVAWEVYYIEK